ncbi:MAG: tetratricopeptide repeat protein [Calditrichaeota bacterium]|nr:MAG: tetratricopeptide repeat protein [Calditrichota bacterium]
MMNRFTAARVGTLLTAVIVLAAFSFCSKEKSANGEKILASIVQGKNYAPIFMVYPQNETLFPPEIIAPTFQWSDPSEAANAWLIHLDFQDDKPCLDAITQTREWTPDDAVWQEIKTRSLERSVHVSIVGYEARHEKNIHSKGVFSFTTSKDSVGAPLFYREVNLPFENAVKDPTKILWRFGSVSDVEQPPIVLENMPVCGNCHSFSGDGGMMGLDVDYANDKGSYAFTPVQQTISLSEVNIITWSDYKRKDKVSTFGLLSQVSSDGRYVVSTVKDRSVFVAKPELAFSQLFFPIKGILAYYDSESKEFHALPGANNPEFVQSNAVWSPDGKTIVFARSQAYQLKNLSNQDKVLLTAEECGEFLNGEKEFVYDLYRIPFNQGKGGVAEPIKGASFNGMSNFFAKYSPDGKWIVFCRAKSYMLLQPDSELYIIPAEGGEARRMRCNTSRMNSWHSWSPNSKWLVFSSKQNSSYTQLFLTHIDAQGESSPPVLLRQFTNPTMAANIPEFVNVEAGAIRQIDKDFLTDHSYVRAGNEALISKDFVLAENRYQKALKLNENNLDAHIQLALVCTAQNKLSQAEHYGKRAIQLDSTSAGAYFQLGEALCLQGKLPEAVTHLNRAARLDPDFPKTHFVLGQAKERQQKYSEAINHYKNFVTLYPLSFKGYFCMIELLLMQGDDRQAWKYAAEAERLEKENSSFLLGNLFTKYDRIDQANTLYKNAIRLDPRNPEPMCNLAANLAKRGEEQKAVTWYNRALSLKNDALPGLVGLASILATSSDPGLRNGKRAVELAEKACALTDYQAELPLGLLAAANAECGNYAKAIEIDQRALAIAQSRQKSVMSQQIAARIEQYKKQMTH